MSTADLSANEDAFRRLSGEWGSIVDRQRRDVVAWHAAIRRMAVEEECLRAGGTWVYGRDDAFAVLGIRRKEVRHSAMLAWLLDPCGRHGLGSRVLAGLLSRVAPRETVAGLGRARVTREVTRGKCRADIVVTAPGLVLVIENKVDAEESTDQCDVLFDQFGGEGARFVLLSPDGRSPLSASGPARKAFVAVRFGDVREILAAALRTTGAKSVGRDLAANYLLTLRKEFP